MLRMKLAGGLAVAALLAGPALAQTTAPTQPAGPGQVMTQMPPNLMRGSKLMGIDVYGADNQKIGDIDEVLMDRQGKIHGVVVGVGGFLGIGQKDVAVPFDQIQWMSNQEVQAASNQGGGNTGTSGTNTAGGVTTPANPGATAPGNQPAATGSTAAGGAGGMTGGTAPAGSAAGTSAGGSGTSGADANMPARAMVKMTKADLQNAPEFRYSGDAASGGGNTNPPAASTNRP